MSHDGPRSSYDVVIVGGGPAGLSAAVYVARLGLSTAVIAGELGGQAVWASRVENYLGFQLVSGTELVRHFLDHVRRFHIDLLDGQLVNAVVPGDAGFDVFTREGSKLSARSLIIATGRAPADLTVPGEKELIGRGVSYCATCDAAFFRGRSVAVVGDGGSAVEAALQLVALDAHVAVFAGGKLRAGEALIRRLEQTGAEIHTNATVVRIEGTDEVTGIVIENESGTEDRFAVDAVFIEAGAIAAAEFTGGLVDTNDRGEIVVDREAMTSQPGIFAAGDVTDDFAKQIIVAAGQGARAGMAVASWLRNTA